jgi:hypothetical protein
MQPSDLLDKLGYEEARGRFVEPRFFEKLKRRFQLPKSAALSLKAAGILLAPSALLSLALSFQFPDETERLYSQRIYPEVVGVFAAVNRARFSGAEALLGVGLVGTVLFFRPKRVLPLWSAAGILLWAFLLLWGFNYARPPLEERMGLTPPAADPEALLELGGRAAESTAAIFDSLGLDSGPTRLPVSFEDLDRAIDDGYRALALPGDRIGARATPAKRLWSSTLFSYLGVSGIFVPFTGEPSVNALQPDAALPLVVAHEKAHQRGITHEGEANFAAFLVCSRKEAPPYLRYAAYLFATQHILGEAGRYLPRERVAPAWEKLGGGPLADLRALREFWERYEGVASEVSSKVNDSYLRAMRVPEGVESYGTVVRLLLALNDQARLF